MTGRESRARRLLRDFVARVQNLLESNPSRVGYVQAVHALEALIVEAKEHLGISSSRRKKGGMVHVDVPNSNDVSAPWVHLGTMTRDEAMSLVKEKFGADDKGRIFLISDAPDEDD